VGFFDAINHEWLVKFVEHRIADKRVLRLIQKWLSAGVMENRTWTKCEEGTPQGATVSPLLANIYLHHILDLWIQQWRNRSGRGDVIVTRFADDFIVGFQYRSDAERFLRELKNRLTFVNRTLSLQPIGHGPVVFGSQPASAGLQYRFGIELPVHLARRIALLLLFAGALSQKLKPNFSRWNHGPT
jgi:Reverse transcriptase (RNA-dependent DNA polymerase)